MTAPTATPHWQPSEQARAGAATATTGRYDDPPPWDGGAHCTGGLQPGTRALGDYLQSTFPNVVASIGGYNCRPNTADPSVTSLHGTGRAVDVMMRPETTGDRSRAGDAIADWVLANAAPLGIEEVIWTRTIWTSQHGVRDYTDHDPHTSHVHIGLSPSSARALPAIPNGAGMSGASSNTKAIVGGIIGGGALLAALRWWSQKGRRGDRG